MATNDPSGHERNAQQDSRRVEKYMQACKKTDTMPVSSFIRQLNENTATVNLGYCGLDPPRAMALALTLANDTVVTHLELEYNDLHAKGAYYLMEMFKKNSCIQSLNLSRNQLGPEGAGFISKMLEDCEHLQSIKLSENSLENSAAKCLSESLKRNRWVREVDLSHNKFSEAGMKHLGDMLAKNTGIEVLDLSWNVLHMQGAEALSKALKVNSTLKELYLSHTDLGCSEAKSLGEALQKNATLVLLDLNGNSIDDQAVKLLCPGLTTNTALKVLKLFSNTMSHVGALMLLETVDKNMNSGLEEIEINTVFVREAFVELLEQIRQRRPSLNVQYTALDSVTRNVSAFNIFKKFLEDQNKSIMDFFKSLDNGDTMTVSTSAFRKGVKEANIPLDKHQIESLVRKFDKNFTATINYSQFS